MKYQNELIHQKSAYLQQHAHNPVNWKAWHKEVFENAQKLNQLVLVSIGYSSCHWCHVMEHESFEDEEVASILNKHYLAIKVDREEHPVVDQQYMEVVQAQTGNGGWPLNCICLPDGTPLVAGTYFPKENFMALLLEIAKQYKSQPEALKQHAQNLVQRLQQEQHQEINELPDISEIITGFQKYWDHENGGFKGAPKFILPINFDFYLDYLNQYHDPETMQYALYSLENIACSGIYDQIEGGFTRYATDPQWLVPHFEKMLYDNGQLIKTYAKAYQLSGEAGFLRVAQECFNFLDQEFKNASGLYAAATDADSDGAEGQYFVVEKKDLPLIDDATQDQYRIHESYWEEGKYIPQWKVRDFNKERNPKQEAIFKTIRKSKSKPFKDIKSIASWNALLLQGLAQLAQITEAKGASKAAFNLYQSIKKYHFTSTGDYRIYQENSYIAAGLEDYAQWCKALIGLYQCTWDEQYLKEAYHYIQKIEPYFSEQTSFYLEQNQDSQFSLAKAEIQDNVIPSVNSTLAYVLLYISYGFDRKDYCDRALKMTQIASGAMTKYYPAYGQWSSLVLYFKHPNQLVIYDPASVFKIPGHQPFQIIFKTDKPTDLLVFNGRQQGAELKFYLCQGQQCLLPFSDFESVLKAI